MKKIKRCNWLTALGFVALFTVLLASCGNVFEDTSPSPVEGSGRVSIDFGGANARTVFPVLVFDEYRYFFTPAGGDEAEKIPDEYGRFTLTAGEWTVRVNAYIEVDDQMFLAATGNTAFTLTADDSRVVRVGLVGTVDSGSGTFSWYIEFPQGAEVESLSLRRLPALTQDAALPAGETTETSYSGTAEIIDAGFWLLNLRLSLDEKFAGISEVVHIYDLLTSEFGSADAPIVFTEAHFTPQLQILDELRWIAILEDIAAGTYEGFDEETGTLDLRPYLRGTAAAGAGLRFNGVFDPWVPGHTDAKAMIRRLFLPDDATGIAAADAFQSQFREFTNLTHVSGASVTIIGSRAFGGAFHGATSITEAHFPVATSIGLGAFQNATSLTEVYFPLVTSIDNSAFSGATSLTEVYFPAVTSIDDWAFSGARSLTKVYFPLVETIGGSAFAGTGITRASNEEFPSLTSIGNSAFASATRLTSVSFPAARTIRHNAFNGATHLNEVEFPLVETIGGAAFFGTALTKVEFPSVITINNAVGWPAIGAFEGIATLTEVYLPLVTSIGERAFQGVPNITRATLGVISFTIWSGIGGLNLVYVNLPRATSIGTRAFYGATSLTSVRFPAARTIGNGAFSGAISLTKVHFPLVTFIGDWAFNEVTSLTEMNIPEVNILGDNMLENTGSTPLTITMNATPPRTLGMNIFQEAGTAAEPKIVTVWVPNRDAYTTTCLTGWTALRAGGMMLQVTYRGVL